MKEKRRGMGMRLCMIQILLSCTISGCSDTPPEEIQVDDPFIEVQEATENSQENAEEIIEICVDLYKEAAEQNKIADLEMIRSIVNRLGENGYPAVDSRNQINMTESEKVVEFCEKVDTQEEAEITILEVSCLGEFVKNDLNTKDGNVDGTITFIVDGVWLDYNSDLVFRNEIVVQPFEDGTFRYLSNSIEQIELELPPIARKKG